MGEPQIVIHRINPNKRKMIPTDPMRLGFGRHFTDHFFATEYHPEIGWHLTRIEPYRALQLDPAAMSLHYGQEIFEGLKAYYGRDHGVYLFRWRKNAERMRKSAQRLIMTPPEEAMFGAGVKALVRIDKAWIPRSEGCSLYIRPTLIATDAFLGVRPSDTYAYYVIASPVGSYYPKGFAPTRILVAEDDVRAVRGGLGEAKTAANYAHSLRGQVRARQLGYDQVLWLDAIERQWVEEVGTSNIFFRLKNDEIITPPLGGTILAGVTRDSAITILRDWGYTVNERPITIDDVITGSQSGQIAEAFATGTAAAISPVGWLGYKGTDHAIGGGRMGHVAEKLYGYLTRLQRGYEEDKWGWVDRIDSLSPDTVSDPGTPTSQNEHM